MCMENDMQKIAAKAATHIAVAVLFLFLGMFIGPRGTNAQAQLKKWRYTTATAQKLYRAWDKDTLFFEAGGEPFSEFASQHDTFILYNWASWCPHCKNVNAALGRLQSAPVPTVALTFDTDWDAYRSYRDSARPFWRDLVQHDADGTAVFTPREQEFNVPLIPSVWIVSGGVVKKIFVGEAGGAKLFPWLERHGLLPAQP